jgi:hypothetical protein
MLPKDCTRWSTSTPVDLPGTPWERLFDNGSAASGQLVETHTNSLGAMYAVYRPAGAPKTGLMGA